MCSKELNNCVYRKDHLVPIYEKNRYLEDRKLNIAICDFQDRDVLQVKVRDQSDFSFNYFEDMDMGDFEVMRNSQNLDINFLEFKTDLIDMLNQHQKDEMHLKVELSQNKCTLVFYGKSKIKIIVYLTVDLKLTNQKEIFSEMNNNLKQLQEINERLKWQLSQSKSTIKDKEKQILETMQLKKNIEQEFLNHLSKVESFFNNKICEIRDNLLTKLTLNQKRLSKLFNDLQTVKSESILKSDSSQRLLKTMESLRIETIENATIINELKTENSALISAKNTYDKIINDLNSKIQDLDKVNSILQSKNEELRDDLEKVSVIIAQKKETNDELARDLVQANQMLVNFNNHYDKKVKQIEDLNNALMLKDQYIQEQRVKTNELLNEFEEYKTKFSNEEFINLKHENTLKNNKITELENTVRKLNKMNNILTQKVSGQMPFNH
ncbi:unnamed protein product [Brassicogethes aeneus]|uniref:Spindle assembly abnormal protein 6 N-terminal domain-containing protein n=1 Tax=Brassicogethes aeneus TaxID=1431903 RepID=A0A9P0FDL3_BRAAE|nr:unnamed protein product [Brassicogethes aeneus]